MCTSNFHATISITGIIWRARSALRSMWCITTFCAREAGRFVRATRWCWRRSHQRNCGIAKINFLTRYRDFKNFFGCLTNFCPSKFFQHFFNIFFFCEIKLSLGIRYNLLTLERSINL